MKNKIWFTSDTHFGHKNIIKYSDRPFDSVEQMDQAMINNWNEVVQPGDSVYHLGDFSLTSTERTLRILDQLNGNIHLIRGNHEKTVTGSSACKKKFAWIKDYYELKTKHPVTGKKKMIVLCHYAMRVWNKSHHEVWHLYGHSHGNLADDPNSLSFDVGVDCHDFRPISLEEVERIMRKKQFVPIDHHVKGIN